MNETLLAYYNEELRYLREMGGEFAASFPKIASRLGLDGFECADPYVERLLEGFGFLAARVRMQIDAQFPRFTRHLADMIYPGLLAPMPSMAVVQFEPDWTHPALSRGVAIPRSTALQSRLDRHGTTRCEYRTAHAVTLLPLRLAQADYRAFDGAPADVSAHSSHLSKRPGATIRLRFETRAGVSFDRLALYLRGSEGLAERLHAEMTGHCCGVSVRGGEGRTAWQASLPARCVAPLGFKDSEALLPASASTFRGCRMLREYFAFPERYLFVELSGLREIVGRGETASFEIVLLLDRYDAALQASVDASNFALHCTPAVNLFARRADRIAVDDRRFEHHVVVDRTRPLDFEVFSVEGLDGYRTGRTAPQRFEPFYHARDPVTGYGERAYFQVRREPRMHAARAAHAPAPRSRYAGSEVFVALVDANEAPYSADLRQLGVDVLCTNRDLPLSMPVGSEVTDFTAGADLPAIERVRCLSGPSVPRPSLAEHASLWRVLDMLSASRLPLVERMDSNASAGSAESDARALRQWLAACCPPDDDAGVRQIALLQQASARTITRRLPLPGPICFGRGLEITLTFDDTALNGARASLLGAVLAAAFADYMPINQFCETIVRTPARGNVMRYPAQVGRCEIL